MKDIALELASRGEQVTVFAGEWNDTVFPENVEVVTLPLRGMSNHARALDFAKKFHTAAAGADVKFAFNRFGGCDFYFAADDCFAAALKRKFAGGFLRFLARYRIFADLERQIFSPESSTVIFYISPKQKQEFQEFYGTPDERFIYLGPGVGPGFQVPDSLHRQKCREALALAPDEKLALFIAANWTLKGGDRVLKAFAALPEHMRRSIRLCFAGGDAGGRAQLAAEKYGIADRCIFAGVRRDVEPNLAAADILVHPARKEAAGTVIAEALACGVPVIVSGICGYASLVADSGAGIVLPEPFDTEHLISAWRSWHEQVDMFAGKAVNASKTLKLRGRAADAVSVILKSGNF